MVTGRCSSKRELECVLTHPVFKCIVSCYDIGLTIVCPSKKHLNSES